MKPAAAADRADFALTLTPTGEALHLIPRIAVLGVGCKRGTTAEKLETAFAAFCAERHFAPQGIVRAASIDLKKDEPGLAAFCRAHGWKMDFYTAAALRTAKGRFTSSGFVQSITGVDNVCERAAVLAADGVLFIPKWARDGVTLAVALAQYLTAQAQTALQAADVLCGYTVYIDLVRPLYPDKEVYATGMTREIDRCRWALETAKGGKTVALVCSGDAGVYGMASPLLELAEHCPEVEVEIVPGLTAALSGAAVLGAPLAHDFCVISLSDRLTPWAVIEKRLACAAAGDFCLALYNPSSRGRADYLQKAVRILRDNGKGPDTVCGLVRCIGRDGQTATLAELEDTAVDMFTTVFVGNAATQILHGRMVTPRGYRGV